MQRPLLFSDGRELVRREQRAEVALGRAVRDLGAVEGTLGQPEVKVAEPDDVAKTMHGFEIRGQLHIFISSLVVENFWHVEFQVDVLQDGLVLLDPPLHVVVVCGEVAADEAEGDAVQTETDHGGCFQALGENGTVDH